MCGPLVRITLSCKGMVDYKVRGGCELRDRGVASHIMQCCRGCK
jgi:hypothetical protein